MCSRFAIPLLLLWCSAACAADAARVLRVIDFEERQLGNAEDLPMHWSKLQGPNLPHYVNGRLTTTRHRSGDYSFQFDLNGGGLIYRYDPRQLKVQPRTHYHVETFVQTTVMPNARARLTAYFTDQDLRPLPKTTCQSDLYAASTEDEGWKKLSVDLSADDPAAAYLTIEIGLLQPFHYTPTSLGSHALFPQDIHGSAWFDDVLISQVPRVSLSTDRPGNVLFRSDPPRLSVRLDDRTVDDLAFQFVLYNADAKSVYQRTGTLDITSAEALPDGARRMVLSFPDLPPGWYQAVLELTSQGQSLGRHTLDLIRLADATAQAPPDPRFGFIATDQPSDAWEDLPAVLPLMAAGGVKIAVWSRQGDVQQSNSADFERLMERLRDLNISPTACLLELPPELARKVHGSSFLQLLNADVETWRPQLAYLVSRHADHLTRWQLGPDGADDFITQPDMRRMYARIYKELSELLQRPDMAMPWPSWYELSDPAPASVALSIPSSVLPAQLPLYVQEFRGRKDCNLSLSLQPLDRAQYGRETQIRDLAQRIVYALSADAQRIDLPLPLNITRNDDALVKRPHELLMILRTLMTTLSGSTFKGKVPIAENVEAFLFDRQGHGIMILWDRGNQRDVKRLAINLGNHPLRIDLWGNTTPLPRLPDSSEGVALEISPMPILLVDIDAQMAQIRASIGIDQPLLESNFGQHQRKIHFTNAYSQSVAGSMKLTPPPGWTITPVSFTFSLNPGESFDREIKLVFPYNSVAGPKTIGAEFTIQGERNSHFTVPIALKLGLSDVGMQTLAVMDGKDIVVQQIISNYGNKPIDYAAFASFPGQARQERLVSNLAPGRSTIKRYRFPNVTLPPNATLHTGLKETFGTRVLNEEVPVQ